MARAALANRETLRIDLPIKNTNRAVGTMLSGEVASRYGLEGLPEDSFSLNFTGSAGLSFGAFLAPGITLTLEGDANDYVGKGLSGGKIVVRPPARSRFKAEDNIIVGNTVLYGATSGEAYFRGQAGERFAVRNSGAIAVVEGVGDHGCEYMTGGVAVILGPTGRNFAAGMSGGTAFVLDEDGGFEGRCNLGMVELERVAASDDIGIIKDLVDRHVRYTDSSKGAAVLADWEAFLPRFVKVVPVDFKRSLRLREEEERKKAPAGSEAVGASA
jgi:glutamate synthase domain-containing protein 3